jgi:hypothetical protein
MATVTDAQALRCCEAVKALSDSLTTRLEVAVMEGAARRGPGEGLPPRPVTLWPESRVEYHSDYSASAN